MQFLCIPFFKTRLVVEHCKSTWVVIFGQALKEYAAKTKMHIFHGQCLFYPKTEKEEKLFSLFQ